MDACHNFTSRMASGDNDPEMSRWPVGNSKFRYTKEFISICLHNIYYLV